MRFRLEKEDGWLLRMFVQKYGEVAYVKPGLSGLQAEIEFPSDWHEKRVGWIRLGFGLFKFCFAFPWSKTVPDEGQCSGPTYGFNFFGDGLHLHWGKMHSSGKSPFTIIDMPWRWRHQEHKILSEYEWHPYQYKLQHGGVQLRTARVREEARLWTRYWWPNRLFKRAIDVEFDAEVGERSGSWKGGCIGCSYEMRPGETTLDTLRRMEIEREFK